MENQVNTVLWNVMEMSRGDVSVSETKQVVFRLASFKFLNETPNHPYAPQPEFAWEFIRSGGNGFGLRINEAFRQLEGRYPTLEGVFTSHDFQKYPDSMLFHTISAFGRLTINNETAGEMSEQLLTFIIEKEGRSGRESITPKEIALLLPRLLKIMDGSVYDGVSGIGRFLIESRKYAIQNGGSVQLFGQEINMEAVALSRMYLLLNGVNDVVIQQGDVLQNPKWINNDRLQTFDYVVMSPPFGLRNWGQRNAEFDSYGRFHYGIPSANNGDMAFVLHAIASLNNDGKAAMLVPLGILFRSGPDQRIREALLMDDLIEAIIQLPSNLLVNTAIPVAVLIINKKKRPERKDKVILIQADEGYLKRRGQNVLREEDTDRIVSAFESDMEVEQYSRVVTMKELQSNEWNLQPKRYFENSEIDSPIGKVRFDRTAFESSNVPKVELKKVAEVFRGFNIPSSTGESIEGVDYKVISLPDVQNSEINFNNMTTVRLEETNRIRSYQVQPGDLILSCRGFTYKMAVVPETNERLIISNNFIGIRPKESFDSTYIKAYLESPVGQYYLNYLQKGATVTVISRDDVENIPIIDIPLTTQREIGSAFIEADRELQERIREAEESHVRKYQDLYNRMGVYEGVDK
ncbi:MAG: N-6 DNA methylase [Candidatus Pristimantibacillus sp.]